MLGIDNPSDTNQLTTLKKTTTTGTTTHTTNPWDFWRAGDEWSGRHAFLKYSRTKQKTVMSYYCINHAFSTAISTDSTISYPFSTYYNNQKRPRSQKTRHDRYTGM